MENMKREEIEALLAGYVLGNLSSEEAEWVQQNLTLYPELEAEVSSLQTTLALIPLSLSETSTLNNLRDTPGRLLRDRILQAADTEPQIYAQSYTETINPAEKEFSNSFPESLPSHLLPFNQQPRHNRLNRTQKTCLCLAGSIAVVLVASLGWQNYRLNQQLAAVKTNMSQSQQEIAALRSQMQANKSNLSSYQQVVEILNQPNNRFITVKGISSQMPASGSLVIAPNKQTALLALQNLPPLPQGKIYRMWAYVDGKKVDCTEFNPDSAGKVMQKIPLENWGDTTSVLITIEPEKAIMQPTGEMVMSGSRSI